jgi:hypothetical protein
MEPRALSVLAPGSVRFERPAGAVHLTVHIEGREEPVAGARVRRAFPLSKLDGWLSIADKEGKEIGLLETFDGLDPESRRLLDEELDRRYFTPQITHVDYARFESGMWRFRVRTDRGATEFFVRNWRDSAYETRPERWMIHSVDGVRYEIADLNALDPASRKLMDQLM